MGQFNMMFRIKDDAFTQYPNTYSSPDLVRTQQVPYSTQQCIRNRDNPHCYLYRAAICSDCKSDKGLRKQI